MADKSFKFTKPVPNHWDSEDGAEMATRYLDFSREELMKAGMTDLHLANAQFLVSRDSLELIHYQTAAKERIRWLSAQLARATALLEEVKQQCLVAESDHVAVTQEPHISEELFARVCDATRDVGQPALAAVEPS